VIEGGVPGEARDWKLKVSATPDASMETWLGVINDMTEVLLDEVKSKADVIEIFQVNRVIFDRILADAPEAYKELMNKFKKVKESYGE